MAETSFTVTFKNPEVEEIIEEEITIIEDIVEEAITEDYEDLS